MCPWATGVLKACSEQAAPDIQRSRSHLVWFFNICLSLINLAFEQSINFTWSLQWDRVGNHINISLEIIAVKTQGSDAVVFPSDRISAVVSWYKGCGINNSLRSSVYTTLGMIPPLLFWHNYLWPCSRGLLGQILPPFPFCILFLKLWVGSLIWFSLGPTNRSTRTAEQWHVKTVRAGWRESSRNSLTDIVEVSEFWNHSFTLTFCRSVLWFTFFP